MNFIDLALTLLSLRPRGDQNMDPESRITSPQEAEKTQGLRKNQGIKVPRLFPN
jgi:hypothetical protein